MARFCSFGSAMSLLPVIRSKKAATSWIVIRCFPVRAGPSLSSTAVVGVTFLGRVTLESTTFAFWANSR